jgi:hypothetical protein
VELNCITIGASERWTYVDASAPRIATYGTTPDGKPVNSGFVVVDVLVDMSFYAHLVAQSEDEDLPRVGTTLTKFARLRLRADG